VSGLHCVIDVNSMEVLRVEDNGGVDEPNVMGEYVPKHIPEQIRSASRREPLKPLHLTQPEGVSSPSTATCCAGRTGRCGSGSTTARE
jgi:primary-amine oxidase